jgi:hypothetical protein
MSSSRDTATGLRAITSAQGRRRRSNPNDPGVTSAVAARTSTDLSGRGSRPRGRAEASRPLLPNIGEIGSTAVAATIVMLSLLSPATSTPTTPPSASSSSQWSVECLPGGVADGGHVQHRSARPERR